MQTSFSKSLQIQYQVIKALVLREVITRWGRKNIAFLWLFVEPLIAIAIIALIWGFRRGFDNLLYLQFNISIIAFILIGYSAMMLWRNSATLLSNAIKSNTALLHHRNLRPLDFYISRFILEVVGVSGAFFLLFSMFVFFSIIPPPHNISIMTGAWLFFIWFALGFGLTFGPLIAQYEIVAVVWRGVSILFFIISGVFFFVAWLPIEYREIALLIPMVHGSEMIKHGYFGNIIQTYEDPYYLTLWCIGLNFTGLMITRIYGKSLPDRL
jgi:capsular polysaccharide transport system permease protein